MPHFFISYSSKDRTLVDELAADIELLIDDCVIWFDRELNRSGGQQWWNLICEEIRRCDIFINALSPEVLKSEPCKREYMYAQALGKPVLPLKLIDLEYRYLPIEIQATQIVDFRKRSRDQQRSLKDSLRNMPSAPPLPPNAIELAPDAPLDPVGVLFDRIARLTGDSDQQRSIILDIEDLHEEEAFQKFVPDLLARLLDRDDVLTGRNMRRAEELRARISTISQSYTQTSSVLVKSTSFDIMPQPFAWIDIPGTIGKTWKGAPYSIAKYPITNAQFSKFIDAGGYNNPQWWTDAGWDAKLKGWGWDDSLTKIFETNKAWTQPRNWTDPRLIGTDKPVICVSWYEALAFCVWLRDITGEAIMLPTEHQWQYAAQCDDGRTYPWGSDWDCNRCNNSIEPCSNSATTPVRQYEEKGDSPFGVVDMAGNVWEWCLSDYDNKNNDPLRDSNNRILRGGCWDVTTTDQLACHLRSGFPPYYWKNTWGFRICRS